MDTQFSIAKIVDKAQTSVSELVSLIEQNVKTIIVNNVIILFGTRLNDEMAKYVASDVIKLMLKKDIKVKNSNAWVLGFTFKEDCPDVRNTKVIDIVNELITYDINVTIFDPWAKPEDVQHLNSFISRKKMPNDKYDSVIFAVSHQEFLNINIKNLLNNTAVFYDVNVCVIGNIVTYRL